MELQSLDRNTQKFIFILTPPEEGCEFSLGRGAQQDLRVTDISVSRSHAKIHFDGWRFTLQDSLSKFGTLVQI